MKTLLESMVCILVELGTVNLYTKDIALRDIGHIRGTVVVMAYYYYSRSKLRATNLVKDKCINNRGIYGQS